MGIRFLLSSCRPEKSPVRQADRGSEGVAVNDLVSRRPSQLNMKNKRFRPSTTFGSITGPLSVNPYWLRLNGGIGSSGLSKKFFASIAEFRTNSNAVPRNWFEPDLVETLTCAIARPYSASNRPDTTLNSSSASTDGSSM